MKRIAFYITAFTAIYLMACLTSSPSFDEKAASTGITIIKDSDEKKPIMEELLSKCRPAGRIEALPEEKEGDYIINRARDLGANIVHIYYTDYYSEKKSDEGHKPELHCVVRFWTCSRPISKKNEK